MGVGMGVVGMGMGAGVGMDMGVGVGMGRRRAPLARPDTAHKKRSELTLQRARSGAYP